MLGQGIAALAGELASKQLDKVYAVEHDLLKDYTPEAYTAALRQLIAQVKPVDRAVPAHLPGARFSAEARHRARSCGGERRGVAPRRERRRSMLVRQLFQGKVNADVRWASDAPNFASLQAGAYRADQLAEGSAPVENFAPQLAAGEIRTKPLELFRESQRAVDLGAAEIIVSVGRGIKEADNIPLVQKLADALGAELAASRPICDAGWLPMERQVGSSGQTVAPKMYLAVGISGAIQHLVGMKGSRTVVAINKDPNAPIFEIADYGIVGDLFQVIPELIDAIQKAK